jgi:hypothetical protein
LSFDWAALTITNLFGGTVTTSNNSTQFTGESYSAGPQSDNKASASPIKVDIGTATGTADAGALSLASTSGSVALTAEPNKTIDLTRLALYQVTLPYSYSFAAIAFPGGGSAAMNGEQHLTSIASYAKRPGACY